MSQELDELFGDAGAPRPRSGTVLVLLGTGVALALLGMACSAAPGGLIVLWAWLVVDKEMERVQSGYLPADTEAEVRRLQRAVLGGLVLVLVLFLAQAWLFANGFYEAIWEEAILTVVGWLGSSPAGV